MGEDFASPTAFSMRIFFCHCVNEADDCAAFFGGETCELLQERDIFRIHLHGTSRPRTASFKSLRTESQRVYWTTFHAFKAENAFRAVFSLARIVRYVNVHRADFFARAALNAFFCVAFYAEQRKITCGF